MSDTGLILIFQLSNHLITIIHFGDAYLNPKPLTIVLGQNFAQVRICPGARGGGGRGLWNSSLTMRPPPDEAIADTTHSIPNQSAPNKRTHYQSRNHSPPSHAYRGGGVLAEMPQGNPCRKKLVACLSSSQQVGCWIFTKKIELYLFQIVD